MPSRACAKCRRSYTPPEGSAGASSRYCSEACARAAKAARQRAYIAEKRAKGEPIPTSRPRRRRAPLKNSDPHADRIVCAAPGCDKLLTVAAVAGGSAHCSRTCAYPEATATEADVEPTEADLQEVTA